MARIWRNLGEVLLRAECEPLRAIGLRSGSSARKRRRGTVGHQYHAADRTSGSCVTAVEACPRDAPEPPSTADDRQQQPPLNMKQMWALGPAGNAWEHARNAYVDVCADQAMDIPEYRALGLVGRFTAELRSGRPAQPGRRRPRASDHLSVRDREGKIRSCPRRMTTYRSYSMLKPPSGSPGRRAR